MIPDFSLEKRSDAVWLAAARKPFLYRDLYRDTANSGSIPVNFKYDLGFPFL